VAPRSGAGSRAVAPRSTATRPPVGSRQTANGVARYGYGSPYYYGGGGYPYYGYGYGGYPCYDWGWPYWGWGWYGSYGWPYFGVSVGASYGPTYVVDDPGGYAPTGPAIVETDVSPSKAEVVLDGAPAGSAKDFNGTWDELRVEPGRHTITFRKDGYRSLTVAFDAAPGGRYVFDQQLAKGEGEDRIDRTAAEAEKPSAPGLTRGLLRIRVAPDDAVVYLDGAYLGTGFELAAMHGALSVAQGEHVVEITRPGYRNESRTILVGSEGHALLDLTLEKSSP